MRLGDSFPETDRRRYVEEQLAPGTVLYLWCEFTKPAKEKYVALACVEPLLLFVVNSSISSFIENRPDRRKCQVSVNACDYEFLQYDSFLDCSQVIAGVKLDEIIGELVDQPSRIKGVLERSTIQHIIDVVPNAKTISNAHKTAIQEALSSGASPAADSA